MNLSEEQILQLAPDDASAKNGKALATPSKWVSKGVNEKALWGECQGSGSKPYQTQVDLSTTSFKCSCPSRKFPCKHGLGLMLLYARDKASFVDSTMPPWVEEWISKRADKQEKKEEKVNKPVDEVAQAKRQKAREQNVADGIEELLLWMKDMVRNGIISIPEKGSAFFESMARRMVDAQAPGLAGMVRGLSEINFYKEGWQSSFMDQFARIYLVAAGFKNQEKQDPVLLQDIKTYIGFTQSQEALKEQTGTIDHWLVLSKQVTEDDNVTTERYWLYGVQSKQSALVLQFLVRGQGGQLVLSPGMYIQAELVFYPSVLPQRAIIKRQIASAPQDILDVHSNWQAVLQKETTRFSKLPFKSESPYIVEKLKPIFHEQQWWLQDAVQNMLPIRSGFNNIWMLLALSGGEYVRMTIIGKEKEFEPVGVWWNEEYRAI